MRYFIVVLALISASPAVACPPSLPTDAPPPSRAELLRDAAEGAPNIVYAVVDEAVGAWQAIEQRRLVRIIHVYKGDLRAGQRIWMALRRGNTECGGGTPTEITRLKGDYGILLLPAYRAGDDPPQMPEFLDAADAEMLIRAGVIRSAREGAGDKGPQPRG
jgi:hypothetical protein